MSTAFQTIDSRRAPRDTVSFRAAIEGPRGLHGSVLIVDISPYGFMARVMTPPQDGDEVRIKVPVVGWRVAVVRWSLGGRLGGEFAEPISPHSYGRLLATAPHDRPGLNEF